MTTRRNPIDRVARTPRITEEAIRLFVQMESHRLHCHCAPRDWNRYWEHRPCAQCEMWGKQARLHEELGCSPGDWPCLEHPDAQNPWPPDSIRGRQWSPSWDRQEVWWSLYDAALAAGYEVQEPSDEAYIDGS
jgi:hypothetical protein